MTTIYWLLVIALAIAPAIFLGVKKLTGKQVEAKSFVLAGIWLVGSLVTGGVVLSGTTLYLEYLWFSDLGQAGKFGTDWKAYLTIRTVSTIAFCMLVFTALLWAKLPTKSDKQESNRGLVFLIAQALTVIVGYIFGSFAGDNYMSWLIFQKGQSFGRADSVFGHDFGFYLFTLPAIKIGMNLLAFALVFAFLLVARTLLIQWLMNKQEDGFEAKATRLVGAFIACVCLNFSIGNIIDRWDLVFSTDGRFYGATALDVNVSSPWFMFFAISWFLLGLVAVFASTIKDRIKAGLGFVILLTLLFLFYPVYWIYGHYYQGSKVSPNEIAYEQEYLKQNLELRRYAFGLGDVKRLEANPEGAKTTQVGSAMEEVNRIRITDFEIFRETAQTLQAIKPFYVFNDADVLAQTVNGKPTQVIWAARELDVDKVPGISASGRRFRFTHGLSAVAGPANEFDSQGQPVLWVNGIPAKSDKLQLPKEQRIYFGESTNEPVIVDTTQGEFDYTKDDGTDVEYRYNGNTGIKIGGFFRRMAIAFNLDGMFLMKAQVVTPESRLLMNRNVHERLQKIAPFLQEDIDRVIIPASGEFWYMQNMYTVSEKFPYSEPLKIGERDIAYLRNSVVAFVNCCTGKTMMVVIDDTDPLVKTYANIYPSLFTSIKDCPEELRRFIRFGELNAHFQNTIWGTHHEINPAKFLNNENGWHVAREYHRGPAKEEVSEAEKNARQMQPDFAIWQMPGQSAPAFWLSTPFSPKDVDAGHPRDNLTGVLSQRLTPDLKPEIIEVRLPENLQFFGPRQVGGYLNQDPIISQRFTLWDQKGSRVVVGDCVTIPLPSGGFFYAQPIFLKAAGMRMPALQFVAVSLGERVEYGASYPEALNKLLGRATTPSEKISANQSGGPTTGGSGTTGQSNSLVPAGLLNELRAMMSQYDQLNAQGKYVEAAQVLVQIKARINQ